MIFFGDSLTEGVPGASFFNILKEKLPEHKLVNCGRAGDTVSSLLNRIKKIKLTKKYDISFLWVGTNDIFTNKPMIQTAFKIILNQKAAKDMEELRKNYDEILNIINPISKKIYTISPLILGEDMQNMWNESLRLLSNEITKISSKSKNIEYIDLQKKFYEILSSQKSSEYIIETKGLIGDYLAKTPENIKKISYQRGLHLTIDGLHLNNKGAQIVADILYKKIKEEQNYGIPRSN